MSEPEEQPSEAFQEAYGDDNASAGEEQHQEQVAPVEQLGPSDADLNDPMSDHWKGLAKSQGWDESFEGDPASGKFQKTAREFVSDGKMIHQLSSLRKDQQRMETNFNLKNESDLALQKAAHEGRISELETQRDDAIDEADRDAAGALQGKIDKEREHLSNIPAPQPRENPQNNVPLAQYEANNPWVKDLGDPTAANFAKAQYADKVYTQSMMQRYSVEDSISIMDAAVKAQFPQTNPNRQSAPASEGASRPSSRGNARTLSYDQLSRQEQHEVDMAVDNRMFTKDEAVKQINKYRQEA